MQVAKPFVKPSDLVYAAFVKTFNLLYAAFVKPLNLVYAAFVKPLDLVLSGKKIRKLLSHLLLLFVFLF